MDGVDGVVMSPDGARWRVRRRWVENGLGQPRREWSDYRSKKLEKDVLGGMSSTEVGNGAGLLVAIGIVLAVFILLPLLGVALELVALLFVIFSGLVARLFFGRPWIVEAVPEADVESRAVFAVKGWRRSGEVLRELRMAIATGEPPPERIAGARRLETRPAVGG